jgi:hypothetical protein
MSEKKENYHNDEIFSKAVRAGKRTYFFDVKSTRGGDLYLTITESKRKYNEDGTFYYEKHKLFLYKEDFDKFSDGLIESIDKIKSLQNGTPDESDEVVEKTEEVVEETSDSSVFTDVKFEDLDKD